MAEMGNQVRTRENVILEIHGTDLPGQVGLGGYEREAVDRK